MRHLPVPRIVDSRPEAASCQAEAAPRRPRPPRSRGLAAGRTPLALLLALLAALLAPAAASAGSTKKILETCSEGRIPSGYSQQAYNQALRQMPPELSEYSDCSDLIHKAQLASAAGGGSGGGPGGSVGAAAGVAPPSAVEQQALAKIPHSLAAPVRVGGEVLHPGVVHVDIASALAKLPTPLLALLAFLLACALALLGRMAHTRLRARRSGA